MHGPGKMDCPDTSRVEQFEREVERPAPGFLSEFLVFLVHNKKWWLAPIILVLLLLGVLVILGGSGAAPFIYPF